MSNNQKLMTLVSVAAVGYLATRIYQMEFTPDLRLGPDDVPI